MISRAESAAATRRALLDAAGSLLDAGGPDAVTLRAVGAQAGVTRGAPYGHFRDKEELLTAIAVESWSQITDVLVRLREDSALEPRQKLHRALIGLVEVGRRSPHRFALMFTTPSGDPEAVVRAAARSQDLFVDMVVDLVGRDRALKVGALLLVTAHGIAGMEVAGHLGTDKWRIGGDELVDMLLGLVDR